MLKEFNEPSITVMLLGPKDSICTDLSILDVGDVGQAGVTDNNGIPVD